MSDDFTSRKNNLNLAIGMENTSAKTNMFKGCLTKAYKVASTTAGMTTLPYDKNVEINVNVDNTAVDNSDNGNSNDDDSDKKPGAAGAI